MKIYNFLFFIFWLCSEAATRGVLLKKIVLKNFSFVQSLCQSLFLLKRILFVNFAKFLKEYSGQYSILIWIYTLTGNEKWYKIYEKIIFSKCFKFLWTYFIDIITPVISSTQIACDVMCVQHIIHKFLHSLQKKIYFFSIWSFFCGLFEMYQVDHFEIFQTTMAHRNKM